MNKKLYCENLSVTNKKYHIHITHGPEIDTINHYIKNGYTKQDKKIFCIDDSDYTTDEFETFDYTRNNYGFRDCNEEDWSIDNTENETWCFGCSITFGVGVPNRFSWPSIIQKNISNKVRNYGAPGTGVETTFRLLNEWINTSKYKPQNILIHGFFDNRFEIEMNDGWWLQFQGNTVGRHCLDFPLYRNQIYKKYNQSGMLFKNTIFKINRLAMKHNCNIIMLPISDNMELISNNYGRDMINYTSDYYQPHPGPTYHKDIANKLLEKLDKSANRAILIK